MSDQRGSESHGIMPVEPLAIYDGDVVDGNDDDQEQFEGEGSPSRGGSGPSGEDGDSGQQTPVSPMRAAVDGGCGRVTQSPCASPCATDEAPEQYRLSEQYSAPFAPTKSPRGPSPEIYSGSDNEDEEREDKVDEDVG